MAQDYTAKENLAFGGLVSAGTTSTASARSTKSTLVAEALAVLNSGGVDSFDESDVEDCVPIIKGHIDMVAPYIAKDTTNVVTVADTRSLDLSGIDSINSIIQAEYPTGNTPPTLRALVHDYGDYYTLMATSVPDTADEAVYVWYTTPHTLGNTASSNTLSPKQERVVVLGLIAFAGFERNNSPVYDMEQARYYANRQTYGPDPAGVHLAIARLIKQAEEHTRTAMIDYREALQSIWRPAPIKMLPRD